MATTKSSAKAAPSKRTGLKVAAAKVKPAAKARVKAAAEPAVSAKATPQATPKAPGKAAPAATTAKAARRPRARKPAGVPLEQRRHYIEMAAYYIAERRGFAPGDPLEDWVQAEAEIDRLLAAGRLGG